MDQNYGITKDSLVIKKKSHNYKKKARPEAKKKIISKDIKSRGVFPALKRGCGIRQHHDTTRIMAIILLVCLEQVKAGGCTFKLYLPGYPSVEPGKGGARRGSAFPVEIYARGWLFHVGVND